MRVSLVWMLLAGCGGGPSAEEAEEPHWGAERRTQQGLYRVSLEIDPDPPGIGDLFVARATVLDRVGEPIEDAEVTLDARMPHHGHGMETLPQMDEGVCPEGDEGRCTHPGGVYTSRGFKFHMSGPWTMMVDVQGPLGHDSLAVIYELE